MKIKERIIYIIIIVALGAALAYSTFYVEEDYEGAYKAAIEQYQARIDSLNKLNTQLDETVSGLKEDLAEADKRLDQQDNQINQVRERLDEEISNVDRLGHSELTSFFTNRYTATADTVK